MQKIALTTGKKLKIAMISKGLRARDVAVHSGASISLIERLMSDQPVSLSPEMAARINGFFGKRIMPLRGIKKPRNFSKATWRESKKRPIAN